MATHKIQRGGKASGKRGVLNVWSGVSLKPTQRLIAEIATYYPKIGELYVTSAYRNYGNDYHSGLQGRSSTYAVDFGAYTGVSIAEGDRRMRDFAKWLEDKTPGYKNLVELIHTTPYSTDNGYYVKNGKKLGGYGYGPATNAAHRNHVHVAISDSTARRVLKNLKAKERDMALSSSDIKKIAVAAGKEVHKDGWIVAPHQSPTKSTNPSWALHTAIEKILGDAHYETPKKLREHSETLADIMSKLVELNTKVDELSAERSDEIVVHQCDCNHVPTAPDMPDDEDDASGDKPGESN